MFQILLYACIGLLLSSAATSKVKIHWNTPMNKMMNNLIRFNIQIIVLTELVNNFCIRSNMSQNNPTTRSTGSCSGAFTHITPFSSSENVCPSCELLISAFLVITWTKKPLNPQRNGNSSCYNWEHFACWRSLCDTSESSWTATNGPWGEMVSPTAFSEPQDEILPYQ